MVTFAEDEVLRSQRAHVALLLHISPLEVDDIPIQDVRDLFARNNADREISRRQRQLRHGK